MALLTDALKAFFSTLTAKTASQISTPSSSYVELRASDGTAQGKVNLSEMASVAAGVFELIPQGSDLNNYSKAGTFSVANGNVAGTISNIPDSAVGGHLYVFPFVNATAYFQIYVSNSTSYPIVYYRLLKSGQGNWWKVTAVQQD